MYKTITSITIICLQDSDLNSIHVFLNINNFGQIANETNLVYDLVKNILGLIAKDMKKTLVFMNKNQCDIIIGNSNDNIISATYTSIWPHYQNDFCFVYANSRQISINESNRRHSNFKNTLLYFISPIVITWIYYLLLMKFKYV